MSPLRQRAFALLFLLVIPDLAHASAAPERKGAVGDAFVAFDPFQVSIVENFRVRGLLMLEVYLKVPDKELRHKAESNLVRLRDAYVRALSDYGSVVAQADRPPDVQLIAEKLQAATDEKLGHAGAAVLITQAYIQR